MPASLNDVVLAGQGLLSAYGVGLSRCADGLLQGRAALRPAGAAFAAPLASCLVAPAPDVQAPPASRLLESVRELFAGAPPPPPDATLYVATTTGEIAGLEAEILNATAPTDDSRLSRFARQVADRLGLSGGTVQGVSSACASSTAALALAASAIRRGETTCALVIGCDLLSEFVLSGFAALMALDPGGARPFDADRRGITLGSAAAFALLMSRARAEEEGRPCLGVVRGWGLTCDANHLTGPSRDGVPLAEAIREALDMAACAPREVGMICAHGTGTVYNDQMEMLAFRRVFGEQPLPLFSVKGGMGHTLGTAGLAEALLALEFLRRGRVPPTVGLRRASPDAEGWASGEARPLASPGVALSTNSGFGGTNAALALALHPASQRERAAADPDRRACAIRGEAHVADGPSSVALPDSFPQPRQAARFSAETRRAFAAVTRALHEAGTTPGPDGNLRRRDGGGSVRVGLVACDRDGCLAANRAYYSDYVQAGRVLGRGQLFACTLPTTVSAECAIAARLTGPLLYVAQPDGGDACARRAAHGLLADGLADAIVLLHATPEGTTARVVTLS